MKNTTRWAVPLAIAGALLATSEAHATPKPPVTWYPAASTNYDSSRRPIDLVVIHKAEGSAYSAAATFANPKRRGSAHYSVGPGIVYQMVDEKKTAWHCGNYTWNQRSVGIENGGYSARADTTDAHYRLLAQLTANICERHKIPVDRSHIVAHGEVPDPNNPKKFGGAQHHWDPGPHFDWGYFLSLVRGFMNGSSGGGGGGSSGGGAATGDPRGIAIEADDLNVRASAWGTVIGQLQKGQAFVRTSKGSSQGFIEIWFRGRRAWIYSSYTRHAAHWAARVDVADLNVRTAASMSGKVVGLVHKGQVYIQLAATPSSAPAWRRISFDEHERYIYFGYSTGLNAKGTS